MTKDLGLIRGKVKVVDYNSNWPRLFQEEQEKLRKALGDKVGDIEHVGSTSVPGLASKPIIDMIAEVDNLNIYIELIKPLSRLGYEYMPERISVDRAFFPKGPRENRTYHLSLVIKGSDGWRNPITFRDYLIAHPETKKQYQELKEKLAKKYPNDREKYTTAKAGFINKVAARL